MFDPDFFSSSGSNNINLSTNVSSSSSALLNTVRAERQAREDKRAREAAAVQIQRVWRGRKAAERLKEGLVRRLDGEDVEGLGKGLVVLLRDGWGTKGVQKLVVRWCTLSLEKIDGKMSFIQGLKRDREWAIILGLLAARIVELVSIDPTTAQTPILLASLEAIYDPDSYSSSLSTAQYARETVVRIVSERHWVERLVVALEKLVLASPPKKKHSSLTPVARLLTAPFTLLTPTADSPFIPPLINHLLAVPSLPSVLPLPALTHLSTHLFLFTLLLPHAAATPDTLLAGRLGTEMGKTCLLANLATFGITGGMLARHGVQGASVWMSVVGTILSGLGEGWGRWVDGIPEDDDEVPAILQVDNEDEDEDEDIQIKVPPKPKPRRRELIPQAMRSKLVIFATSAHLNTLSTHILSASSGDLLGPFATFCVGLLSAFRGSPKWEGALDALGDGEKGRRLVKRIWREGVRGKWAISEDRSAWDTLTQNPNTPPLVLLTYIYNHYLLLTPDDEFFAPTSNALSTDEILELAGVWRDLAFWGYMNGVSAAGVEGGGAVGGKSGGMGSEEVRGLFTRGVTRVVERNGRRRFADPDFWVMRSHADLKGFVEAAVYEDSELTNDGDVEMTDTDTTLPRWARARQRFTKRQMAFLSPRLGLLNNLPMSVPFQTRLEVFSKFIESDQHRLHIDRDGRRRGSKARIRRTHVAEDGFDQLGELGPALKGRVEIVFVDKYGLEEAGIDGGGLFKEFLTSLSKEVFDTNRGLWLVTDQNELYPNPHSYASEPHQLNWYRFIGQVLGKAIYEGILVDVSFADFFLAKWLGRQSYLDDLASLDRELYKGLIILKNYAKPEELALNFAITEGEFGVTNTVELVPGGAEIAVTAENRHEYIQLVCKYKLDKQIAAQSRAFFIGLSDLIDAKWLRMFDQRELSQLIGGEETLIDIDDLRAHCSMDGFPDSVTPTLFWKVVRSFTQEERKALLRFVTSCSRPPLLGFAHLYPKFGVRFNGADTTRLPSASACFNLLKLPGYVTEQALRSKLLQAITSGAGFDMS